MTRVPAIMVQGTGSNVGKSLIVAGLCRLFARRGLAVRPFKPQNMSNNAAAAEGGEIGRAQALQARAAGVPASVHMNPVLLKPETDRRSQVILQGHRHGVLDSAGYRKGRASLMPFVLDSFAKVGDGADLVLVEGAGSPAETNLREGDIANMGFAAAASVPVIIVGDIDRGGVIASLVGTHAVLDREDRARVRAFLINRFRGDVRLFDDGIARIEVQTGWAPLGTVPYWPDAQLLPAEDSLDLVVSGRHPGAPLKVACPVLPRIANFDDLDPLRLEPGLALDMVAPGRPLPGDADLVVLPGSKATIADLAFLRTEGWDIDLLAHRRRGGHVLGLCGGYQMLGRSIADPSGVEGPSATVAGLGLLAVETILTGDKTVRAVSASAPLHGSAVDAYEIHLGRSHGPDCERAPFRLAGKPEGALSPDGRVMGTYLHGLFAADAFRAAYLRSLTPGGAFGLSSYAGTIEAALDALADHLEAHLDTGQIFAIARSGG